jgi:hypothetical protein
LSREFIEKPQKRRGFYEKNLDLGVDAAQVSGGGKLG